MATVTPTEEKGPEQVWYALDAGQVLATLDVDAAQGLTAIEAAARLEQYGPNKFAEAKPEPRWRAFVRQYRDMMQVVLLVVGIGSIWPLQRVRDRDRRPAPDGLQCRPRPAARRGRRPPPSRRSRR